MTRQSNKIEAIYPLSPMQEGLLFHTIYAPGSGLYVEQLDFSLQGQLNVAAFKQAWQTVIDRHSVLRTLFVWQRRDKPLQVARRQVKFPWTEQDWRNISPDSVAQQLQALLKADATRDFDLGQAPLLRLMLLHLAPEQYHFIWSFHHILLDGWSSSLILKEVFAHYELLCQGQMLQVRPGRPYRDYILWLQQQDISQAETFWRQMLRGFSSPTPLQVNRNQPNRLTLTQDYAEQQLLLSPSTTAALQSLARQHQVTLNTLLQAAWALLLSRYSGESDVLFGATVAGRPAELAGVEEMVGLFINTLPARIQVPPDAALLPWLKQIQARQADARQYEYTPLVQIQRWSELPPGQPLFESLLVFENYPLNDSAWIESDTISIRDIRFTEKTNYPLTLLIAPGQELWLQLSYNGSYFDSGTISRMLGHLRALLESMVASPQARLADLPLLTAAEQQQILTTWNQTDQDYPQNGCIQQLFEEQVARTPDAVAVVFETEQLTYRELNERANQLAHHLQALGVGPEVRVGICAERSLELVIGLYAILKAGGAYVPLDPTYPKERLAFMLADAQAPVLLTQKRLAPTLPEHQARLVFLDADWETISARSRENPSPAITGEQLAYVIYTSGSTGRPKGAMNSHRGVRNRLLWMQAVYQLDGSDRVLQKTPFSFDVSVWEFFWPLLAGACLVVAKPEGHKDPAYLVEVIAEQKITTLHFVPSMLRAFVEAPRLESCASLKRVICSGEDLPFDLQERFFARLPQQVELHNLYGPTEAAVDVTAWTCRRCAQQQVVPIGRPIANIQIYLLDPQLQPVPAGVPGELHIGGVGLGRGYLNRPGLTAAKFIPNPFSREPGTRLYKTGDLARFLPDGNIEYLSRIDHQVKIRGFRIEPGEIEAVLAGHHRVREAVVLAREDTPGDQRLVAYYTANGELDAGELQAFLKEKLPDYMVPSAFVPLEAIPLTPSGKLNRNSLPAPVISRAGSEQAYVAPRNQIETLLADIWADVLGVEKVGIDDDFFALGGHSLLATQLIFRLREAFQVELPLRVLFENSTVAALAQTLAVVRGAGAEVLTTSSLAIDFEAEAALDEVIRPKEPLFSPISRPAAILLTGATGFLGAFLLAELLQQTGAEIYCLVRADSVEAGRQRLQKTLESYLLWDPSFQARIIPLLGDLAQPYLGLSEAQFWKLAGQIDLIYHNGALINFVYPYHRLKPANVLGTQEILRLATCTKSTPVHYISTISVFNALPYLDHGNRIILEQEPLNHSDALLNGYAQSKWIAEKLVTAARERGLPVSIYRPGVIAGHSQTGVWNTGDFMCRFIKGCVTLGYTYDLDEMLQLTPVDYASQAIVYLSLQPESSGQTFHVLSPHRLPQRQLDDWLRAAGYPLRQLSYYQWRDRLVELAGRAPGHALYPLLPLFIERIPRTDSLTIPELFTQDREPHFDRQNLVRGLAGTDLICPPIDAGLFARYLSYFIRSGFLPPPKSREQHS